MRKEKSYRKFQIIFCMRKIKEKNSYENYFNRFV